MGLRRLRTAEPNSRAARLSGVLERSSRATRYAPRRCVRQSVLNASTCRWDRASQWGFLWGKTGSAVLRAPRNLRQQSVPAAKIRSIWQSSTLDLIFVRKDDPSHAGAQPVTCDRPYRRSLRNMGGQPRHQRASTPCESGASNKSTCSRDQAWRFGFPG